MNTVKYSVTAFIFTIAIGVIFNTAQANKPMYKWKDSNGEIKYTQFKPPVGTPFTTIKHRVSKESLTPATKANTESEEDEILRKQGESMNSIEKAKEEFEAKNCQIATNNAKVLGSPNPITVEEDGEKRYLTQKEKLAKLKSAQANMKKYCKE